MRQETQARQKFLDEVGASGEAEVLELVRQNKIHNFLLLICVRGRLWA